MDIKYNSLSEHRFAFKVRRPSWFHGIKRVFFWNSTEQMQANLQKKKTNTFSDKIIPLSQFIMKNILLILLIFGLNFEIANARGIRISWGGNYSISPGFSSWIKHILTSNIRSYSVSDSYQCSGTGTISKNSYLCDETAQMSFSWIEWLIYRQKEDIDATYVNQYDRWSVNYYNKKISEYNSLIGDRNKQLKEQCISRYEYCLPYSCHQRFPGTAYSKLEDRCLCVNGKEFDKNLSESKGDWCYKESTQEIKLESQSGSDATTPDNVDSDDEGINWTAIITVFIILAIIRRVYK
jgi:hypothetical protein